MAIFPNLQETKKIMEKVASKEVEDWQKTDIVHRT